MASFLAARRRLLAQRGRSMTLTRGNGGAVAVTGYARDYRADELVAGITQGDRRVEIMGDTLETPPRKGDRLFDGATSTVQGAFAVREGEAVIGWSLWVRG